MSNDLLLVVDIGNTNVVLGGFQKGELRFEFRLKTDLGRTVDEYVSDLLILFERRLGGQCRFSGGVISSVVPPLTPLFEEILRTEFSFSPLVVRPGQTLGIDVRTVDPSSVGADRIINALAARELFGAPALVVDFGTATTFDIVGPDGAYEGGVIAPGLGISVESLVKHTAKLPNIELSWPSSIVGRTTVGAMQSGAVVGYLCLVDGLIERISSEVGAFRYILATGGLGKLMTEHSRCLQRYEPHLTLHGMRLFYERMK